MNRRDILRWVGMGAVIGGAARPWQARQSGFVPDVEIALTAAPDEVQLLPGALTRVWRFTGRVLKGPADALQPFPHSYLGPTIRVRRGQKVRIRFSNRLPESSIVHWHGLDVPYAMDGHPHSVINQGADYVYEFEVTNRAGTYWYHPHPHGRTGPQVYQGLAGLFIVGDDEETALRLPSGEHEITCVLQDRRLDARNQLVYLESSGMSGMMAAMRGFFGDRVLVNGQERPTWSLATRAYRFRVLNGSNARFYKLAWSDETPMTVIGGDGGLLERPIGQRYVTLAPGQRVDLILDLSGRALGTNLQLLSAPFPAAETDVMAMAGSMGAGRGRGMRGAMTAPAGSMPNGAALTLLDLRVARAERSPFRLPARLSTFNARWQPVPSAPVRRIPLSFQAGQWLLGGRAFEMMEAAADETVTAGSTHIWELANVGGMMGMQMAHPIHLHGLQFRVLSRARGAAASLHDGIVDAGWTDTVVVMPGDTVRIQVTFTRHPGLYLYHCHLLEHEDMGMMRNFRVTA
jgi:FtsP/CotA-like multicopper oxidase with cupredoxin domain